MVARRGKLLRHQSIFSNWCRTPVIIIAVVFVIVGFLAVQPAKAARPSEAMATIFGEVTWKDMYDNLHPLSWARVTFDDGVNPPVSTSSMDGWYSMIVPAGTYVITVAPTSDFAPATVSGVVLTPGSSTMVCFNLELTPRQIPEMPTAVQPLALVGLLFVLAVAVRRINAQRMMIRPA